MAAPGKSTPLKRILRDPAMRRMGAFLVTSIVVHLLLFGATGRNALCHPHLPLVLQAQLRAEAPDKPATVAMEGATAQIDPPAAAPDNKVAEIQAAAIRQPVETQRVLNLPADIYYANNEVDVRAEPLEEVSLIYPVIPYQQRLAGSVKLNIYVNERGGIDKTVVVESKPSGIFDEAALQAVAALKFSPAIKNGKPVKNHKTIAVNFDPYEKINTP